MSTDLLAIIAAVRDALDGGRAFAPRSRLGDRPLPDGTALVLRTSGSTGVPREVALGAAALRASADATHARLGGPGRWLLVLPPTHVAGVQVVTRSVVARTPLTAAPDGPFTAEGFARLASDFLDAQPALPDGGPGGRVARAYVSLVPTQLHRLVDAAAAGSPAGLAALARFDAVLVGGAATPAPLLAEARGARVRVVTTYGMSETSGGCVYDGVPLPGVRVRLVRGDGTGAEPAGASGAGAGAVGVIELSGPVLALGYAGDPAATRAAFRTDPDGTRWFRTSDLGRLDEGRLTVLGRADDVVVTGGVNVAPAAVEAVLAEVLPGVLGLPAEACVVGVPDPEWGQAVVAVIALAGEGPGLTSVDDDVLVRVRTAVAERLGTAAAPRRLYVTGALPTRGPGKTDRRAVADAARAAVG
ncbi:AMP-binding protein [Antribacter sp. KLBMP9083]|uniref:AMP-binding protein n=1 Tax=Antribacter soli TaxID=2910976 RepID=A0AA41Q9M1_9MICO|nr:AMP-binding protein [Antribacter soli]MCF4119395.1 AMP-binding protein [Antribacter soli]